MEKKGHTIDTHKILKNCVMFFNPLFFEQCPFADIDIVTFAEMPIKPFHSICANATV